MHLAPRSFSGCLLLLVACVETPEPVAPGREAVAAPAPTAMSAAPAIGAAPVNAPGPVAASTTPTVSAPVMPPAPPVAAAKAPPTRLPPMRVGDDEDAHGCIGSAGYSWCAKEKDCVRPWELSASKGFANSKEAFDRYCTGK